MVDIKSMALAAEGRFKSRILESGFHDKESADSFVDAMGQCFREILGDTIRGALEEDRKRNPRGVKNSGGGSCNGSRGKELYNSSDSFPFGKYGPGKGDERSFGEVPSHYLDWLIDQDWIDEWPGIVKYIQGEEAPAQEKVDDSKVPF
jgi:hypothetical protein